MKHNKIDILRTALDGGMIPLFNHSDVEISLNIFKACERGGSKVVEFTNRGTNSLQVFSDVRRKLYEENSTVFAGIGSIADAPTAALFISNGADFVVSPFFDEGTARLCNKRMIPYIPGCSTIKEIMVAVELGCDIIKIFPGEVLGSSFIKAALAPLPRLLLMPTGGVNTSKESLTEWFAAGVACVGIGSKLISPEIMKNKDYKKLEDNVRSCIGIIRDIRGHS